MTSPEPEWQEPPTPDTDELRRHADSFRRLAKDFDTAKDITATDALRWSLCVRWGLPAAKLLCRCLDYAAFCKFGLDADWDLRMRHGGIWKMFGWDSNRRTGRRSIPFVKLRSDGDEMELPFVTFGNEDDFKLTEHREATAYLVTWFAAIRWWLAQEAPSRFHGDLFRVFHPWVDGFHEHPLSIYGTPTIYSALYSSVTYAPEDVVTYRSHAEIQREACLMLAAILEKEARIIDRQLHADPGGQAKTSDASADKPVKITEGGAGDIPPLDKGSGEWITHVAAAQHEGTTVNALKQARYRTDVKSTNGDVGKDNPGREFRVDPEDRMVFWYRASTLTEQSGNNSP